MVEVLRKTIKSITSIDNPKPWFEVDINEDGILVTAGNCGCHECPQIARMPANNDIVKAHPNPETHVVPGVFGLDLDDVYQFVPLSELAVDWTAHLAWYYPDTDSWLCLEFQEQ